MKYTQLTLHQEHMPGRTLSLPCTKSTCQEGHSAYPAPRAHARKDTQLTLHIGTPHTLSSVVELTIKVMYSTPGRTPHILSSVVELSIKACTLYQEGLHILCLLRLCTLHQEGLHILCPLWLRLLLRSCTLHQEGLCTLSSVVELTIKVMYSTPGGTLHTVLCG